MTQRVLRMRYRKVNFSLIASTKSKTVDLIDRSSIQSSRVSKKEIVVVTQIALHFRIGHMGDGAKFSMIVQIGQIEGVVPEIALKTKIGSIAIFKMLLLVAILHEGIVATPIKLVSQQEVLVVDGKGVVCLVASEVIGRQLQSNS